MNGFVDFEMAEMVYSEMTEVTETGCSATSVILGFEMHEMVGTEMT